VKRTSAVSTLILGVAALVVIFGAGAAVLPDRATVADPLDRLARLYQDCRYFELRDALAETKGNPAPALDFFRGATANAFNRLDESIALLRRYLDGDSSRSVEPLAQEAWLLLADSYRRSGQYRKSAEAQRAILDRYGTALEASDKENCENQETVWSALGEVPPPTVEISGDSVIRMENRHFPVRVKDRIYYFAHDTGSSLSVLYRSAAEELGLALSGQGIKFQSAAGKWIEAPMAVVPEMRLGEVVIRNALFLVVPDGFFPAWRVRAGVERRGLIGAPILAALKEFTETRDGVLLIPASPQPRPVQNMCFFGFMPIVELIHRGARLSFCLDTGSAETFLYPSFFRRYRGEIESRSQPRPFLVGGVGDEAAVKIRVLDEFAFKAGGLDAAFRRVAVHTQVTHLNTGLFFGTLGLDLLTQCRRMTLNFESMSFVLE
jgi:hypothetical protein